MTSTFLLLVCIAFTVVLSAILFMQERERSRTPAAKVAILAVLVVCAAGTGWISWRTVMPPPVVAEAELMPGQGGLDVDVGDTPLLLVVHGQVSPGPAESGTGHYALDVTSQGQTLATVNGTLEQHWQTRKVTRRTKGSVLVSHLEGRHELPGAAAHQNVHIAVTKEDGALHGPLQVSVIPAPPSEPLILLVGIAFVFGVTIVERRGPAWKKSHVGIGVALYGAFALLLLESNHPLTLGHLVGVVPMACLLGAIAGGLCRWIVGLVVRSPDPAQA